MYSKIVIKGKLKALTGLHIGTGGDIAVIGAADSPVIRDVTTKLPMIPASSLKGKVRTLLAKSLNDHKAKSHNDDCEVICRLFGSTEKQGRLIFSDMYMDNFASLVEQGIESPTEIKFENTINRLTGVANPRQIERAIRGTEYGLEIIYTVDNLDEVEEDIKTLCDGLTLLEFDYLGGSGTRGYGKVKFTDITVSNYVGGNDEIEKILDNCNKYVQNFE